jgi:hypothetical protein
MAKALTGESTFRFLSKDRLTQARECLTQNFLSPVASFSIMANDSNVDEPHLRLGGHIKRLEAFI